MTVVNVKSKVPHERAPFSEPHAMAGRSGLEGHNSGKIAKKDPQSPVVITRSVGQPDRLRSI